MVPVVQVGGGAQVVRGSTCARWWLSSLVAPSCLSRWWLCSLVTPSCLTRWWLSSLVAPSCLSQCLHLLPSPRLAFACTRLRQSGWSWSGSVIVHRVAHFGLWLHMRPGLSCGFARLSGTVPNGWVLAVWAAMLGLVTVSCASKASSDGTLPLSNLSQDVVDGLRVVEGPLHRTLDGSNSVAMVYSVVRVVVVLWALPLGP